MKFISNEPASLRGDKEEEIFDLGYKFFESALKSHVVMGGEQDWSIIDFEYLIAAKFYANYQLSLLTKGKKLLKMIDKEINRRILHKYVSQNPKSARR